MLEILRNNIYRNLLSAQIIALIGTGLATIALGLLAYDLAGGMLALCSAQRLPSRWSLIFLLLPSSVPMQIGYREERFWLQWTQCVRALHSCCLLSIRSGKSIC